MLPLNKKLRLPTGMLSLISPKLIVKGHYLVMLVEYKNQKKVQLLLYNEEKIDFIWKPFNGTH